MASALVRRKPATQGYSILDRDEISEPLESRTSSSHGLMSVWRVVELNPAAPAGPANSTTAHRPG
jgi:hypothetical protein